MFPVKWRFAAGAIAASLGQGKKGPRGCQTGRGFFASGPRGKRKKAAGRRLALAPAAVSVSRSPRFASSPRGSSRSQLSRVQAELQDFQLSRQRRGLDEASRHSTKRDSQRLLQSLRSAASCFIVLLLSASPAAGPRNEAGSVAMNGSAATAPQHLARRGYNRSPDRGSVHISGTGSRYAKNNPLSPAVIASSGGLARLRRLKEGSFGVIYVEAATLV